MIENAIKYTATNELVPEHAGNGNAASKGHIQIGCRTPGRSASVTVSDNGPGVGPEHVPHIFERFYRVDAARSDVVTGTGLGLAICRSIVESHGGRDPFESQPGKGSTVTVVLPQAENAVGESQAASHSTPIGSRHSVGKCGPSLNGNRWLRLTQRRLFQPACNCRHSRSTRSSSTKLLSA